LDLFVSIAQIVKTRGVRGELVANLLTDFPKRFASVRNVRILCEPQVFEEEIESYWFNRDRVILRFKGRDTPEAAVELLGGYVQVPEAERFRLPRNTFYHSDLIGCRVEENRQVLGEVTGIFEAGGDRVNLEVSTPDGREFMVPMVKAFVKKVDLAAKVIQVKTLPGLF
jgi:16S rRNA processing protein RimM